MRSSILMLIGLASGTASCEGPREWALPYDGSAFPTGPADGPARNPDPEKPPTVTGGSSGEGGTGAGAGGAGGLGTGRSGGGGPAALDAGNQPIDADQPPGGCDSTASPKACVGEVLRVCDATGTVVSTSCAGGCSAIRLECNQCRPNSRRCEGANLVVCNAEGTGTTMMACTSGCDPASNDCRACEPGAVWCASDTLRECTPAGEPRDRQTCGEGCDPARKACNVCRPGTKTCSGNTLQTCNAEGTGTSPQACAAGCSSTRLACNSCDPGTKTCSGNTLRTCRSDGSGWIDQSCPSGCSAERCNTCNPGGGRTCDGNSVRQCLPDGSGFDLTPCSRGCAAGACCSGNNEAAGGSCRACGGNNQPCCEIANPACGSNLACQNGRCVVPCGANDGQCPSGCNFSQDRDCKKPNGEGCGGDGECQSGNCAGNLCCPNNQHGCGGRCVSDTSVETCGTRCDPCPEPANATASCGSNRQCTFTCRDGFMRSPDGRSCTPACGGERQDCCATGGSNGGCMGGLACVGNTCLRCGRQAGDSCCSQGRPCGEKLICDTARSTCAPCGDGDLACCGPGYSNINGRAPTPGTCNPMYRCVGDDFNGYECEFDFRDARQ